MFEELWEERERVSFLTGRPLTSYEGTPLWYSIFAHVSSKAKNRYPKFILHKPNIVFLDPEEHTLFDYGNEESRARYTEKMKDKGIECDWQKLFDLKEELRQEYISLYGGY